MTRISTSMIHTRAVAAMNSRQSEMAKTYDEVSSGKRVTKPSDDPAASVHIFQLEQKQLASTQYGSNITAAKTRLQTGEQGMSDAESAIQRVRELAVQLNSSALGTSDRQSIATELTEINKQLMDIGNRQDSNGDYLYAGLATGTQPFSRGASGSVSYAGDAGVRNVQVSASQSMQDGDSGASVFMNVPQGNGTFVLSATATNTGTGVVTGSVQNISSWVPDNYTLTFTNATTWQVTDSSSNVVSTGAYTSGTAISFNGVQVTLTGAPASGDTFKINKSSNEDVFTTIDNLIAAANSVTGNDAAKALYQNKINASLQQLDGVETHFLNVRSSIGVRLSALETVDSTRQDASAQNETLLSGLRDSDYASAVSRYSQQYTALQAAQSAYAKIANLSLFSYL